jgi:hypothetical protein
MLKAKPDGGFENSTEDVEALEAESINDEDRSELVATVAAVAVVGIGAAA